MHTYLLTHIDTNVHAYTCVSGAVSAQDVPRLVDEEAQDTMQYIAKYTGTYRVCVYIYIHMCVCVCVVHT
jgi:hypothetical protein